ncbi:hypothetical protein TWF132_011137 [Orbilia oligospora]|nr:hypothetical protein TWF132_011137 [Orbilia oligospora]
MEPPKPFPAPESLLNSTPSKDSIICASKSRGEDSPVTKILVEELNPYGHSYLDSNGPLRMICPHASERPSTNEVPGPTKYMDGGGHQANETPGAESLINMRNVLVAQIIEGGIKPTLEERLPLSHNLSMGGRSETPMSLSHTPTNITEKDQAHERHVINQTACNKVDYPVPQAERKGAASSPGAQPSTEELDHLGEEYEVERVEGYRARGGKEEYLVKWKRYDDRTWEPVGNLKNAPLAVDEYRKKHTQRKRKRGWPGNQAGSRKSCQLETKHKTTTNDLYTNPAIAARILISMGQCGQFYSG